MIEVKGMIAGISNSILIYFGANHRYINANLIEICKLVSINLAKERLVQLATNMKRKITTMVENCCLEMDGFHTKDDLGVIPLGSYHVLIGMD